MLRPARILLMLLVPCVFSACSVEDADGDGVRKARDCDDRNPAIHPGAQEICNGRDDDCDGQIDVEAIDAPEWFTDADNDGYGDLRASVHSCTMPPTATANALDCNDLDPNVTPETRWYWDDDHDGYGAPSEHAVQSCEPPGEFYVLNDLDCDDSNARRNPEISVWTDQDSDGFGRLGEPVPSCSVPDGVELSGDCDDTDPNVYPGKSEQCDGVDQDCDGEIDNSPTDGDRWYPDNDGDSFGDGTSVRACTQPPGTSANRSDCDDSDPSIYPGAVEFCDGVDTDCDSISDSYEPDAVDALCYYADVDRDSFGNPTFYTCGCDRPASYVENDDDCDDTDYWIYPGSTESCDGQDQDCDGIVDNGFASTAWYEDLDSDGYGDDSTLFLTCMTPSGSVTIPGDCDDSDPNIRPGGLEFCDGVDSDCDSLDDSEEPELDSDILYYRDNDADGHGRADSVTTGCPGTGTWSLIGDDCDDTVSTVYPGAPEICGDGVINDCDGSGLGGIGACWAFEESLASARLVITGIESGESLGSALTCTGDLNGDGLSDLLVGAPLSPVGDLTPGAAFLFSGAESGSTDRSVAFASFPGSEHGAQAGTALASAGDQNGDGQEDLLVSAPRLDSAARDAGAVWLFAGPFSGEHSPSEALATFLGQALGDQAGQTLGGASDIDGDGLAELIIGAPGADDDAGAVYVVDGASTGTLSLSSAGRVFLGSDGSTLGTAIVASGDLDGDGITDLALGAPSYSESGRTTGAVAIFLGDTDGILGMEDAGVLLLGAEHLDRAGAALAVTPDMDGDGFNELVVGAPNADGMASGAGIVYVAQNLDPGSLLLTHVDTVLLGEQLNERAGQTLASAGDADLNGAPDLLVGAPSLSEGGLVQGGAWLVLVHEPGVKGLSEGSVLRWGLSGRDGTGSSLAGGEDLDDDGLIDLVVGSPGFDASLSSVGAIHLFSAILEDGSDH